MGDSGGGGFFSNPWGLASIFNPTLAANAFAGTKGAEAAVKGIDAATGAKAAREAMQKQAEEANQRQLALEADLKKRKRDEEDLSKATEARDAASRQKRALLGGRQGRAGTLLTSPLGLGSYGGGGTKTLLGS